MKDKILSSRVSVHTKELLNLYADQSNTTLSGYCNSIFETYISGISTKERPEMQIKELLFYKSKFSRLSSISNELISFLEKNIGDLNWMKERVKDYGTYIKHIIQ